MKSIVQIFTFTIIAVIFAGCIPIHDVNLTWQLRHLRYIDPIDSGDNNNELIAVYSTEQHFPYKSQHIVRLDFVELQQPQPFDLYIYLDLFPGSQREPVTFESNFYWEIGIYIPSYQRPVQVFDQNFSPISAFPLTIQRHADQDYLEVGFLSENPLWLIPRNFSMKIVVVSPNTHAVLDQTPQISATALAPQPIQVLFVFWDTFPAFTPVQAIRRWDGAHTGPLGGRHGLYSLLRAANSNRTPVVLLDLKNPFALSALEFAKKRNEIILTNQTFIFVLPDNILIMDGESQHHQNSKLSWQRQFFQNLGYPVSPFAYISPNVLLSDYPFNLHNLCSSHQLIFSLVNNPALSSQISSSGPCRWLGIPEGISNPIYQPSDTGLSAELKKKMITSLTTKSQTSQNPIIIVGGSLPFSTWGDPQVARAALNEIKNLPWIHLLDANDLLGQPPSLLEPIRFYDNKSPQQQELDAKLKLLPGSFLQDQHLRWIQEHFLFSLEASVYPSPPALPQLRTNLLPLLSALRWIDLWNSSLTSYAECPQDITSDGIPDCILSNQKIAAWIDPLWGSILFVFSRDQSGVHEIIGPASQLVSGLTDSATWDLSQGIYAENRFFEVALRDSLSYDNYQIAINKLQLSVDKGELVKTIELRDNTIQISYSNSPSQPLYIPFLIDPWHRFEVEWSNHYFSYINGNIPCWTFSHQVSACVSPSQNINIHTFKDTQNRFETTENPNIGNPPGHFLPFPLALFEMNPAAVQNNRIEIQILDSSSR